MIQVSVPADAAVQRARRLTNSGPRARRRRTSIMAPTDTPGRTAGAAVATAPLTDHGLGAEISPARSGDADAHGRNDTRAAILAVMLASSGPVGPKYRSRRPGWCDDVASPIPM